MDIHIVCVQEQNQLLEHDIMIVCSILQLLQAIENVKQTPTYFVLSRLLLFSSFYMLISRNLNV